jgi:hypothetical protein
MNQTLRIQFHIAKEDRDYTFTLPYGAPNGEINDVLHEMRAEVIKIMQEAINKERE